MSYLKKFGVGNFKVFKELTQFDLAPITILTGINSCGKSSILNAIELLGINFKKEKNWEFNPAVFENLEFNKEEIKLSGFSKVKTRKSDQETIKFSNSYQSDLFGWVVVELIYAQNKSVKFDNGSIVELNIYKEKVVIANAAYKNNGNGEYRWILSFNQELCCKSFYELLETAKWQNQITELIKIFNEQNWVSYINKDFNNLSKDLQCFVNDFISNGYDFNISKNVTNFLLHYSLEDWNVIKSTDKQLVKFNASANKLISYTKSHQFLFHFLTIDEIIKYNIFKSRSSNKIYSKKEKERASEIIQLLVENEVNDRNDFLKEIRKFEQQILSKEVFRAESSPGFVNFDLKLEDFNDFSDILFFNKIVYELSDHPHPEHEVFYTKNPLFNQFVDDEIANNRMTVPITLSFIRKIFKSEIEDIINSFTNCSKVEFISSIRLHKQSLIFDVETNEFANTIFAFENLRNKFKLESKEVVKRISFIKKWVKQLDIGDDFVIERDNANNFIKTYIVVDNEKHDLISLGYGINQFLPVIIRTATLENNSQICVEEPEANLHPCLQSQIAEFFVDAYNEFGHHFILETHSEYLIRKLQFMVAKKEFKVTKYDLSIYYLYHPDKIPEGKKQVEKLEISEDGCLDQEFGTGFFDEATNWKFELMRIKHAQKN